LTRPIKPTPLHRPQLPRNPRIRRLPLPQRLQGIVEPYKIERRPDPGDAGNNVQPPHQQPAPIQQVRRHERPTGGSGPPACAVATPTRISARLRGAAESPANTPPSPRGAAGGTAAVPHVEQFSPPQS